MQHVKANTELEHVAIVTSTIFIISIFECVSWRAKVCVPSTSVAYLSKKPAKVYTCTKTNEKLFKTTECIKKSKV